MALQERTPKGAGDNGHAWVVEDPPRTAVTSPLLLKRSMSNGVVDQLTGVDELVEIGKP